MSLSANHIAAHTPKGLARLKLMAKFGWDRGAALKECGRLFYHAGIKPSLAFRGLAHCDPAKVLQFEIVVANERKFRIHVRDNLMDITTFAEFFSSQYVIIPLELVPFQPQVIYDIGANIGIASLFLATHYPESRYYGFEPVPSNCELCAANYTNLVGAQVFPWAVGRQSGVAQFEFEESDLRGGHIFEARRDEGRNRSQRISVNVVSIADLVSKQQLPPPDFLKVDVEGAEIEVLEGIGPVISQVKRMLVETHSLELQVQCLDWLKEHGFVIHSLVEAAPGFASIWADRR
jgi:FkbM family methyltransferase